MRKPHTWHTNPDWSPKTHFDRTCEFCLAMAPHGGCMLPFRRLIQVRRWKALEARYTRLEQRRHR